LLLIQWFLIYLSYRQLEQIASNTPNVKSDNDVAMALAGDEKSRQLTNSLDKIVDSLPFHLVASQKLNTDTGNAVKDIAQSEKQCKNYLL